MKNNYSIAERNRIVEEYLPCIDGVIRQNRDLIRAACLEYDDVYQDLAICLILCVEQFDPEKGSLRRYIHTQLCNDLHHRQEIRNLNSQAGNFNEVCWRVNLAPGESDQCQYVLI